MTSRAYGVPAIALTGIVMLACSADPTPAACTPTSARALCREGTDPFTCGWTRILDDADSAAIASALDVDTASADEALRVAFPVLEGKTLVDDAVPVPAAPTFTFLSFDPYLIPMPIDWASDPYASTTWRLELQSLGWLDSADLDTAAYLIRDWTERAMSLDAPLEYTWDDAGMAKRINYVARFLDAYAADRDVLDRGVVRAVARLILTHLYALSSDVCYAPQDNHGMMENVAVLANLRRVAHLTDRDAIWDRVETRTVEHVDGAVTEDGIHVEHSPAYQLLYLGLLLTAIDAIEAASEVPPAPLVDARDGLFAGLIYLLQPNGTLPQLGDTENGVETVRLAALVARARAQTVGDPAVLDQLEWVLTDGATGTQPVDVDRVFTTGGYAAFRERWDASSPGAPVTGHFTCSRLSSAHYHKDETSFEIYGYGAELIVDSGKYSYDRTDPFAIYQREVAAHNVLVVDDASYEPNDDAHIVDHDASPGVVWVQGVHTNYQTLGVAQARTFAFVKPSTFVVIDHVHADTAHGYAQHVHLAPELDQIDVIDDRTVIATSVAGGATVVIQVADAPVSIDQVSGRSDGGYQGWYFPGWQVAVANTDVVFRYQRDGGDLVLPIVITIAAPGAAAIVPTGLTYTDDAATTTLSWSDDIGARSLAVPSLRP